MGISIHPTALVDAKAELADGVEVGPYAVIEAGVAVGEGTYVGPFCRLSGPTTIGARNRFESHCSIGSPPQDLKYHGEPTRLEIGDGNTFREFVTFNRGTVGGGGVTSVANDGLFMAYTHVAHDCHVGSRVIFDNCGTLAGHVDVGDDVVIGAFSAVHQFSRIGDHAFLGGFTTATKDCLPFMRTVGNRPAKCYGPNTIGLQRKGFSEDRLDALKKLWRILHNPKLTTTLAVERARAELSGQPDVDAVLAFIEGSQRGVILARD
ncbi:MAG TPA: acyl-ACP--UDP-N-acetylglucosamine O-acyltransferase [Thermoanaerobaculales bacterium]|nr:acyl-ACP--UDP-N-acetylglucosamine O-acyltransferase [Thermoanaerobaculales bacterium]HQN95593.1 acyl-ACP--UDP-N-acetylglucosamine O-acyltransferase [Thermoanaerobaculales bacterium]